MKWPEIAFFISLGIVFYTFIGYGLLIWTVVSIKKYFSSSQPKRSLTFTPAVTLIVPCFNEASILEEKIKNCQDLIYPEGQLYIMFITDGSTDESVDIIGKYPHITLLHSEERKGKSAAENRAIKHVRTPYVVFCDANTHLNPDAIELLMQHYINPNVGAVSGEKKVLQLQGATASGTGEGAYWKYESFLKKMDSELNSLVGAAGELISFRTELFEDLPHDTILDDFVSTLKIGLKGYKVSYEPKAIALELPSSSVEEELKRKIRICAGGWQAMSRLKPLLNPFKYGLLSFQYISHRVLRWSITPLLILLLIPLNIYLSLSLGGIYNVLLMGQVLFYAFSVLGFIYRNKKLNIKGIYIPYYFTVMQYSVYAGFIRFINNNQQVTWEKAQREVSVKKQEHGVY